MDEIPTIVLELASRAKGTPIAWKEYPDGWTIVFEDGRKLQFKRKGEATSPPVASGVLRDPLPQGEGSKTEGKPKKKGGSQA